MLRTARPRTLRQLRALPRPTTPLLHPLQTRLKSDTSPTQTSTRDSPASTSSKPAPEASTSPLSGYVESVELNTSPTLSGPIPPHTRNLISSLLDLFGGQPSLPKLSYWATDSILETPLNKSTGLPQVTAQWYAMKQLMDQTKVVDHMVTKCSEDGKNVEVDMKVMYKLKGLPGKALGDVDVERKVDVEINEDGKIQKVRDNWGGKWKEMGGLVDIFKKAAGGVAEKVAKVPKS